jgi:2-oxoglutarate/2-oxoacid ferredoxin oxidoreductase subunit alpha
VFQIDVTKLTREALADIEMGTRDKDRSKNMFVLGFIYWLYNRKLDNTKKYLEHSFKASRMC